MPVHALTSPMFSSDSMARLFSAESCVQRMLDVEAALARALATADLIPEAAVEPWQRCCKVQLIDLDALSQAARSAGNLAIPLVKQLTARVAAVDGDAARHVHRGATSQDIIDTGLVFNFVTRLI